MGRDYAAEAAALNATPPVKFVGMQFDYPLFQQEPPGVGSFVIRPDESMLQAYERARRRYMWEGK